MGYSLLTREAAGERHLSATIAAMTCAVDDDALAAADAGGGGGGGVCGDNGGDDDDVRGDRFSKRGLACASGLQEGLGAEECCCKCLA